jgi:hypothetical protein
MTRQGLGTGVWLTDAGRGTAPHSASIRFPPTEAVWGKAIRPRLATALSAFSIICRPFSLTFS